MNSLQSVFQNILLFPAMCLELIPCVNSTIKQTVLILENLILNCLLTTFRRLVCPQVGNIIGHLSKLLAPLVIGKLTLS